MKTNIKLLLASSGIAIAALGASPALAAGTAAGSTITNNVTINYTVGSVAQTAINRSNDIIVDRKVNLTVVEVGTSTTSVVPGQSAAVTTFTVTNTSNSVLDLGLAAAQTSGGTAAHGGTDNFDVTGVTMYVDTGTQNGVYDAGTDLAVTYLDEIAADAARTIFVVASVPITRVNGDVANVTLTAQAQEGGTASSQGANVTETSGANTAGMDTVFADAAGAASGDAARDGKHSDDDDYTVAAPVLTVTKQSRIVSDPINGTTNPKMIPGATVEYCIVVANAAAAATANSVNIGDTLPTQTTYDSGYGIFENGTYTTGTCNLDGTAGGSFGSGAVSGTLGSVAGGTTKTLYFRVTIN